MSRENKNQRRGLGTLASIWPQHQALVRQTDPASAVTQLLLSVWTVADVPEAQLRDALTGLLRHHMASHEQQEDTIVGLRDALLVANDLAQAHDEEVVHVQGQAAQARVTAQNLGRQILDTLALNEKLATERAVLAEDLKRVRSEAQGLREELERVETCVQGVQSKLLERFLDLASVKTPQWIGERERLISRVQHLDRQIQESLSKLEEAIALIRDQIEDCERLRSECGFASRNRENDREWNHYLDQTAQAREQFEAYEELVGQFTRLEQRRFELLERYQQHVSDGEELRRQIVTITGAVRLIDEDVWALCKLDPSVLRQFTPTSDVLPLLINRAVPMELGKAWRGRYDSLQAHVVEPGVARGVRERRVRVTPHLPVEVRFLPGSVFEADSSRELEALVAIFLQIAYTKGHKAAITPDVIGRLLAKAGLLTVGREQVSIVKEACLSLVRRGVLKKGKVQDQDLGRVEGYVIVSVQAQSYLTQALSQVSGGHGQALQEHIRKVIPDP